jgi:hypothetical protein
MSIVSAFAAIVLLTVLFIHDFATESAKLEKQRRQNLPTCTWVMEPGQSYSCFLSHYKVEAGAEARYLKE